MKSPMKWHGSNHGIFVIVCIAQDLGSKSRLKSHIRVVLLLLEFVQML